MILHNQPSDRQTKPAAPCIGSRGFNRIQRHELNSNFSVELEMADGSMRVVVVKAAELFTYNAFRKALLHKYGIVFGEEAYERRGGATAWREDLEAGLNRFLQGAQGR